MAVSYSTSLEIALSYSTSLALWRYSEPPWNYGDWRWVTVHPWRSWWVTLIFGDSGELQYILGDRVQFQYLLRVMEIVVSYDTSLEKVTSYCTTWNGGKLWYILGDDVESCEIEFPQIGEPTYFHSFKRRHTRSGELTTFSKDATCVQEGSYSFKERHKRSR